MTNKIHDTFDASYVFNEVENISGHNFPDRSSGTVF